MERGIQSCWGLVVSDELETWRFQINSDVLDIANTSSSELSKHLCLATNIFKEKETAAT